MRRCKHFSVSRSFRRVARRHNPVGICLWGIDDILGSNAHVSGTLGRQHSKKQLWTGRAFLKPIPQRNGVRRSSEKYASQRVCAQRSDLRSQRCCSAQVGRASSCDSMPMSQKHIAKAKSWPMLRFHHGKRMTPNDMPWMRRTGAMAGSSARPSLFGRQHIHFPPRLRSFLALQRAVWSWW